MGEVKRNEKRQESLKLPETQTRKKLIISSGPRQAISAAHGDSSKSGATNHRELKNTKAGYLEKGSISKRPNNDNNDNTKMGRKNDHVPRFQAAGSHIYDDIESEFSFDDMSDSVGDYNSYHHGSGSQGKRKRGPPRYPPLDRDRLYAEGLLVYLRDFHLGMII